MWVLVGLGGSRRVWLGLAGSCWVLLGLAGSWHLKGTQWVERGPRGCGQYLAGLDFNISMGLSWSKQVLVSLGILEGLIGS